ncbi:MAG: hypothetical protein Q8N30_08915 [Methylococcales bacterium]|nr:hypothetical protein [Methylococcales bacterium]
MIDDLRDGFFKRLKSDIENISDNIEIFKKASEIINNFLISGFKKDLNDYYEKRLNEENTCLSKHDELFNLANSELVKLTDELNKIQEGDEMESEFNALAIGTKIAAVGATLFVIGLVVLLILQKKKKNVEESSKDISKKSEPSSFSETTKKITTQTFDYFKSNQSYHLLLLIPANKATILQNKEKISIEQLNNLIDGTTSAYFFKDSNEKGNQLLSTLESSYSEENPVFTTNERILVYLTLSAEESIIGEKTKLNIKNKIKKDADIQIKKYGKLKSKRFTTDFYDLY